MAQVTVAISRWIAAAWVCLVPLDLASERRHGYKKITNVSAKMRRGKVSFQNGCRLASLQRGGEAAGGGGGDEEQGQQELAQRSDQNACHFPGNTLQKFTLQW